MDTRSSHTPQEGSRQNKDRHNKNRNNNGIFANGSRSNSGGGGGRNGGGSGTPVLNGSHWGSNRQHYQHRHSRTVTNLDGFAGHKTPAINKKQLQSPGNSAGVSDINNNSNTINNNNSSNNNNNSSYSNDINGGHGLGFQRDEKTRLELITQPSLTRHGIQGGRGIAGGGQTSTRRSTRRTVSLPKAGSMVNGQNHSHLGHQNSHNNHSADTARKTNSGSRPTTQTMSVVSENTKNNHHNSTNTNRGGGGDPASINVFPPIGGSHGINLRDDHDPAGIKSEIPPSLSPRVLAACRMTMMAAPGQPDVPLSRLHFLPEPSFDSFHMRTTPNLPKTPGMVAGRGGAGGTGANGAGTAAPKGLRGSTLSPELALTQQYQQQQQEPLSPLSLSERAKTKFEKKVQLTGVAPGGDGRNTSSPQNSHSGGKVNGTANQDVATAPGGNGNNNDNNNRNSHTTTNGNATGRDSVTKSRSRRESTTSKSLPKISQPEEPFNIRRKIEQFRKWHEEQYLDRLKRLGTDAAVATSADGAGGSSSAHAHPFSQQKEGLHGSAIGNSYGGGGLVDYAKVLEVRIAAGDRDAEMDNTHGKNGGDAGDISYLKPGPRQHTHLQHFGREHPVEPTKSRLSNSIGANAEKGANAQIAQAGIEDFTSRDRPISAVTWKTWRDVNQSDAYTDVKKYIRDNDLMDEEREAWIKSWITDVEQAKNETGEKHSSTQRAK